MFVTFNCVFVCMWQQPPSFSGLLMFGSYSVINVIVLLNLLIAMMSNSYAMIDVCIYSSHIFTFALILFNIFHLCPISIELFFVHSKSFTFSRNIRIPNGNLLVPNYGWVTLKKVALYHHHLMFCHRLNGFCECSRAKEQEKSDVAIRWYGTLFHLEISIFNVNFLYFDIFCFHNFVFRFAIYSAVKKTEKIAT